MRISRGAITLLSARRPLHCSDGSSRPSTKTPARRPARCCSTRDAASRAWGEWCRSFRLLLLCCFCLRYFIDPPTHTNDHTPSSHSHHTRQHTILSPPPADDPSDARHITSIARAASEAGLRPSQALFVAGEDDVLAPPSQCRLLADIGEWPCRIIPGAAHNVPIEQPELWRQTVLEHLDS